MGVVFAFVTRVGSGRSQALILLEGVAAFSLLGYLAAELYGRTARSSLRVIAHVASLGMAAAIAFQWIATLHPGVHQSVPGAVLLGLSAAIGAGLHRAQIALAARQRSRLAAAAERAEASSPSS
ncbi:MAG TPA: hypothetical protein VF331_06150 [Polyangiales bacterium]